MYFASILGAWYLNHWTFIEVFSYPLLVLPSLLAVWTLILSPWALLLHVFLHIFAEQMDHLRLIATLEALVRAWQESIGTASQVFIQ